MPAYDTLGDRERNLVLTAQQRGITEAATIANGQSVTGWIAARGCWGLAVDVPASWTSADLAIELSDDASTSLGLLRDDTGEIVRTVVNSTTPAGRYVVKPAAAWATGAGVYFRLVSVNVASEAAVNQGGARSLTVRLAV